MVAAHPCGSPTRVYDSSPARGPTVFPHNPSTAPLTHALGARCGAAAVMAHRTIQRMSDDGVLWSEPLWSSRAAFRELFREEFSRSLRLWGMLLPLTCGAIELLFAIASYKAGRPLTLGVALV